MQGDGRGARLHATTSARLLLRRSRLVDPAEIDARALGRERRRYTKTSGHAPRCAELCVVARRTTLIPWGAIVSVRLHGAGVHAVP
eukprot:4070687-Pleurochrysis_carterae.AAC.1